VRHGRMTYEPYKGQNRFVRVDQLPLRHPEAPVSEGPAKAEDDLF